MKKLLTIATVGVILATPAVAIKKCVQYGNGTTCTSTPSNWTGKADWEATCITNGNTVDVHGAAACSNSTTYSNDALPSVDSYTATNNVNCWCKMLIPAESSWVYIYNGSSASDCAYNCASKCADAIAKTPSFRNALFTSIGN